MRRRLSDVELSMVLSVCATGIYICPYLPVGYATGRVELPRHDIEGCRWLSRGDIDGALDYLEVEGLC